MDLIKQIQELTSKAMNESPLGIAQVLQSHNELLTFDNTHMTAEIAKLHAEKDRLVQKVTVLEAELNQLMLRNGHPAEEQLGSLVTPGPPAGSLSGAESQNGHAGLSDIEQMCGLLENFQKLFD